MLIGVSGKSISHGRVAYYLYGLRFTRTAGSVVGLYLVYGWEWFFWREAHEYFMSPFAIFLWGTSFTCDGVYAYALWRVQKTELVLEDGRKVAGDLLQYPDKKVL